MKNRNAASIALAFLLAIPGYAGSSAQSPAIQQSDDTQAVQEEKDSAEQGQQVQKPTQETIQEQVQEPTNPNQQPGTAEEDQANAAEVRSIQALHQAQLTWVGVHLIGLTRLDNDEAKDKSWEAIQNATRNEISLLQLVREYSIPLTVEDEDLKAMRTENQQMLSDLARAPVEGFEEYFEMTVAAKKTSLLEFLKKEAEQGFAVSELQIYINSAIAELEDEALNGSN